MRFRLVLFVDTGHDNSAVDAELQAVASPPNNGPVPAGTPIGDVYHASSVFQPNGAIVLDFGSVAVPVEANPILPATITATLALEGSCQADGTCCGTLRGDITAPVALPLNGSTWALVPWNDGLDAVVPDARTSCRDLP